jgi:hypothetical protein
MSTKNKDLRPALVVDDVQQSYFSNLHVISFESNSASILLKNSSDICIKESVITGNPSCFVKLDGIKNSNISILNNLAIGAKNIFLPETASKQLFLEVGNQK